MQIKVFDKPAIEVPQTHLKLEQRGTTVDVVAVNSRGDRVGGGLLLSITEDGILVHSHVGAEVKLPKDSNGRIKVVQK